jgi:hypothetical protein
MCALVTMAAITIGAVPQTQEGNAMSRQPEEQNLLVSFEETPEAPDPPDIGIAIRVWPAQIKPGNPVFLAGSYSADCALIEQCQQDLPSCVVLTLLRTDGKRLLRTSVPLISPIVKTKPPPLGANDPYYRVSEQFRLDIIAFFELPRTPAAYTIEATLGTYSSGQHVFRVVK